MPNRPKVPREQIIEKIKEHGAVSIGKLASELGYSYGYFKHSILRQLVASNPCIYIDPIFDIVKWDCEEGDNNE